MALYLKASAGREALLKLAAADVFVQNFRSGVIERMGLLSAVTTALADLQPHN